jgi:hypothetical protein
MSDQYNDPGYDQPMPGERRGGSNVLGIVGFILAFCISPVGLLVSLIALMKPPRGFAIAGVVVGLIGSVVWGVVGYGLVAGMPYIKASFEGVQDFTQLKPAIEQYQTDHGAYPASLDVLGLSSDVTTDPWGTPYRLVVAPDGTGYQIISAGMDATFETADDITIDSDMSEPEVGQAIGEAMGEHIKEQRGN